MKTASKKHKATAAKAISTGVRPARRTAQVLLAARWTTKAEDGDAAIFALAGALPDIGVGARLWRPFEDRLGDARCLHLFGTTEEFLPLVETARAHGLKVVLSPELWRETIEAGRCGRGPLQRAGTWLHKTARGLLTRTPAWQRDLFAAVDLLLPNSNVEAQCIVHRTNVPLQRMRIVPHGVDPQLAAADPRPFRQLVGLRDFVLYVGDIGPENQQLAFLWAMNKTDVPAGTAGQRRAGASMVSRGMPARGGNTSTIRRADFVG